MDSAIENSSKFPVFSQIRVKLIGLVNAKN